jgi:hypothetical protein
MDLISPGKSREIVVELVDYKALNDSKDCTSFAIYGKPLTTTGELDRLLVYSVIQGKKELDVFDMVYAQFYRATIYSPFKRQFHDEFNTTKYLCSAYMSNLQVIEKAKTDETTPN